MDAKLYEMIVKDGLLGALKYWYKEWTRSARNDAYGVVASLRCTLVEELLYNRYGVTHGDLVEWLD